MANSLLECFGRTAFAFRGYNVTNLGRSAELLAHPTYGPIVRRYLVEADAIASDVLKKRVRLERRIREQRETTLRTYGDAVALIVAMECAQIELLRQCHGIEYGDAPMAYGYSLGEIAALTNSDVLSLGEALTVVLAMAPDCAELAKDVQLGIVFSRGPAVSLKDVQRLCIRINQEGQGVIGVSSILSPNTVLLMGQGRTIARFKEAMPRNFDRQIHLRVNSQQWPPMHTPIVWQHNIPCRAAHMMHTLHGGMTAPVPPVLSMVTGKMSYDDQNTREMLHRWIDQPQRLWDAVYGTLVAGVDTVVHVGPSPNLIPATFNRLHDNVTQQVNGRTLSRLGARAVSRILGRQWLASLMPSRTALLRVTRIRQVILEDWLLDHDPK